MTEELKKELKKYHHFPKKTAKLKDSVQKRVGRSVNRRNEMPYILDDNLPDMKPCPFCGREPALQKDKRYPKMTNGSALPVDAFAVVCNTFSCPIYHADNTWFTTAETAIEKWNTRIKTVGDNHIPLRW